MQARVSPRPLLGIPVVAEGTGLIAKKGLPRLCWPPAWCRQVARHGGLGDAETEHEKLAMDSWRSPEEILPAHADDELADLNRDPGPASTPATTPAKPPKQRPSLPAPTQGGLGLNHNQAAAPTRPPARQEDPKQAIE